MSTVHAYMSTVHAYMSTVHAYTCHAFTGNVAPECIHLDALTLSEVAEDGKNLQDITVVQHM
jgi:hypothetical protein